MRIGIIPGLNASDGGIYQYSRTMLDALDSARAAGLHHEFVIFASNVRDSTTADLSRKGWVVKPLVPPTLKRRSARLVERVVGPRPRELVLQLANRMFRRTTNPHTNIDEIQFNDELDRWFRSNGIDLMVYPISTSLSFETRIPYILAVHDLQHRLQPEFPEVSANGEWNSREYLFRNAIRNATFLLAESETGKEDILNFYGQYGVTANRVKILPLLPSSTLTTHTTDSEKRQVCEKYNLPAQYLFYPAQFWPHKNHVRVVEALGLLRQRRGLKIPIVFCGSYAGSIREQTFNEVYARVAHFDLAEQIHYLGYVPDGAMSALYAGAIALIMPTFFGPSNIPVLEAWQLSCPVLTSNIRGIREQSGNAAILVDPSSVEEISEGIYRLWTNEELRESLIERGKVRLKAFTADDFRQQLVGILQEATDIVQNGKES